MINFVTEPYHWVLRRYCDEFAERIPNSKVSTEIDNTAEVNLFFPYYFYTEECTTKTIAFFTHREENTGKANNFDMVSKLADCCIAMSYKTADLLPKDKTSTIKVYPDKQFYKEKIVLGVVGKECPSGRKRFEIISDMKRIAGVEVLFADSSTPFKDMPDFYKKIDYLVITANNEGGPMPVVEAIAMGKPVISPDVGFAWDYSVIRYNGSVEDLIGVIRGLIIPNNGWDVATKKLLEVIESVKDD